MSATFRSATSLGAGGPTYTVAKPAGVVDGDLLLVAVLTEEVIRGESAVINAPAGWTGFFSGGFPSSNGTLNEILDDGGGLRLFWFAGWRVASSEPSSYTFTIDTSSSPIVQPLIDGCLVLVAYQSPNPTTPILLSDFLVEVPTGGGPNVPSVTPPQPGVLIVDLAMSSGAGGGLVDPTIDEAVVTVDDSYATPNATVLTEPAPGVLANDTYDPGHQIVDRVQQQQGADDLFQLFADYPWDGTATGVIQYPVSGGGRTWAGSLVVVLADGGRTQNTIADCTLAQITTFPHVPPPPFGTVALAGDGSFVYDPLDNFGTDEFFYRLTGPRGATDDATVTIHIGYPPVTFANVLLKSEPDAGASGPSTGWPVFSGDALFKGEA